MKILDDIDEIENQVLILLLLSLMLLLASLMV